MKRLFLSFSSGADAANVRLDHHFLIKYEQKTHENYLFHSFLTLFGAVLEQKSETPELTAFFI